MGDAGHVEAFDVASVGGSVAIDDIINCAFIALLKDGDVNDLYFLFLLRLHALGLTDKHLIGHARNLIRTVAIEDDDIVDRRTVLHELVLFEAHAHEAIFAVDVEFFGSFDYLGGLDVVE